MVYERQVPASRNYQLHRNVERKTGTTEDLVSEHKKRRTMRRVGESGQRRSFKSVILPPYMRKSAKVSEVLPLLYLHGLSSGDFIPALEE